MRVDSNHRYLRIREASYRWTTHRSLHLPDARATKRFTLFFQCRCAKETYTLRAKTYSALLHYYFRLTSAKGRLRSDLSSSSDLRFHQISFLGINSAALGNRTQISCSSHRHIVHYVRAASTPCRDRTDRVRFKRPLLHRCSKGGISLQRYVYKTYLTPFLFYDHIIMTVIFST